MQIVTNELRRFFDNPDSLFGFGAPSQQQPSRPKRQRAERSVEFRLFSTSEAARYLGISEWKLRSMVHEGKIEYIPGKYWRFDRESLDRWITTQRERRNA